MPVMYISPLTIAKVGQRLQVSAKVVDTNNVALRNAFVIVAVKKYFESGVTCGIYRKYTSNAQGVVSDFASAGWVLHNTDSYEVKICAISLAGYTWDNRQGTNSARIIA